MAKKGMDAAPGAPMQAAPGNAPQAMQAQPPNLGKGNGMEDEEEEGGEEEEKGCKAAKSLDLTSDDLEKSLQRLEEVVMAGDVTSRKDALLEKAQATELSKSERDELFGILGGTTQTATSNDLLKGMRENTTINKALDVSDYLTEQHNELCKSLTAVSEHVQKSDARQHEFNLILAKAVSDVGNLVKSVAQTVGAISAQPARAPKSAGVPGGKVLQKSFAGSPAGEDNLSKAEIQDALDTMMEKSMVEGRNGTTETGHDLLMAISKYEQTSQISPSLLAEVQKFRTSNRAVTH